jgi:hypothetical protein
MATDSSWKSTALGNALIYAIEHDPDGNMKRSDLDEPKQLINSIFESLGL